MPLSLPCGCAESGWLPGGASPSALLTACACAPQVSVPPGALDCWVFLSCLEVLQRIEGCCDRAQIDSNIAHTVGLWSYAMEKVAAECRGSLSGLCPRGGGWSSLLGKCCTCGPSLGGSGCLRGIRWQHGRGGSLPVSLTPVDVRHLLCSY